MRRLFSFPVLYLYTLFIIFISVIPVNLSGGETIPFLDKITHFLIYTALSFLAINTLKSNNKKNCYLKVLLYSFSVGLFVECIQYFLPYRNFEAFDIFANSLGSLAGIIMRVT